MKAAELRVEAEAVPCPYRNCGAAVGESCRSPREPRMVYPHHSRADAARAARGNR